MYHIDVEKLIDYFGGDASVVQGFKEIKSEITISAVQVWRHRRSIPKTQIAVLGFQEIADRRAMKFDIRNFIIKPEDNHGKSQPQRTSR